MDDQTFINGLAKSIIGLLFEIVIFLYVSPQTMLQAIPVPNIAFQLSLNALAIGILLFTGWGFASIIEVTLIFLTRKIIHYKNREEKTVAA